MDDYRQSEEYCQYFTKKGWIIESIGNTRALIKKVPGLGSIIKIHRGSATTPLTEIEKMAKRNKALLVVVEPDIKTEDPYYIEFEEQLKNDGYKDLNLFLSPTKTTYIDLTKSEEQILASFDEDIRKGLKRNQVKNILFKSITPIDKFHALLNNSGDRLSIFTQDISDWKEKWEPFDSQIQVIQAYLGDKLLGGNMFTVKPPVAFGLFLPSTIDGRDNRVAASLIWEAIKVAKRNGCTKFDLNGLYDERYRSPKRWHGLTAFKKKFRGHEVEYMHPKVKVYSPYLKYLQKLGLLWVLIGDIS